MDALIEDGLGETEQGEARDDNSADERRFPARPIVAVGAVILRGDDVLLIRRMREPKARQWSLPGGAQELGETVLEALHREIREEVGLMVEVGGLIDVVDYIERDDDGAALYHYTLVDYWATIMRGYPRALDGVAEARFVPVSNLADYGLWRRTVEIIHRAYELSSPPLGDGFADD